MVKWIIDITRIVHILRQSQVINDVLLSKRQALLLKYHPLWILERNWKPKFLNSNHKEEINQIDQILGIEEGIELSNVDKKLIDQLFGNKSENNWQFILEMEQ